MDFTSSDFRSYNRQSASNVSTYMKNWHRLKGVHPFIRNFEKTASKRYRICLSKEYIDNIENMALVFTWEAG